MDNISIRTTIIIKFAIQPTIQQDSQRNSSDTVHVNAGKVCAVCGSQLHMTKHCPVHP